MSVAQCGQWGNIKDDVSSSSPGGGTGPGAKSDVYDCLVMFLSQPRSWDIARGRNRQRNTDITRPTAQSEHPTKQM